MIILKDEPKGIDEIIQFFQNRIYSALKTKWSILNETEYQSYGRVYKNNTDSGYKPEVFESSVINGNTIYKEVYFDNDVNSVLSFWNIGDNIPYKFGQTTAPASLIFILNIAKLKPNSKYRADEEIKKDILTTIQTIETNYGSIYTIELTGFETGYKNVFKDFDGLLGKDQATYRDKHPLYNLKVNINIKYNLFNS